MHIGLKLFFFVCLKCFIIFITFLFINIKQLTLDFEIENDLPDMLTYNMIIWKGYIYIFIIYI